MKYLVIDLETEGKEIRGRFCDPLDLEHQIVTIQWIERDKTPQYKYDYNGISRDIPLNFMKYDVIVGQNVKFDLLWLWGNKHLRDWVRKGGKVWDTKTVDYLLNGQNRLLGYGLDEIAKRYGSPLKYEKKLVVNEALYSINDMYRKPLNFTTKQIIDEIGFDEFLNYMKGDVITTEDVYLKQLQKVQELKMEKIVDIYMEYYLQLIEIEYKGIYIDKVQLEKLYKEFNEATDELQTKIRDEVSSKKELGWPKEIDFNLRSVDHVSVLCYSGYLATKVATPITVNDNVIRYVSGPRKGEIKTRLEPKKFYIPGYGIPVNKTESMKKVGYYKSSHKILSQYDSDKLKDLVEFKKILTINDDLSKKIHKNMNPYTGCIHSAINTTVTSTSRISSRAPNLQNLNPKTLSLFCSRFPNGRIVELDWCQVEVAVAAFVFKDGLLQTEVLHGIDMHTDNARKLFNKHDITAKERKIAKFFTFGILYKQSAKGLSETHHIDVNAAKRFIDFFYNKYVDIASCHEKLDRYVNQNAYPSGEPGINLCTIKMPWGKRYTIRDWPWKDDFSFSPQQYCNYVIQGTAGDIQAIAAGILFRFYLLNEDSFAIVNNVHDSFILDFVNEDKEKVLLPKLLNEIEMAVEVFTGTKLFKLEAKSGKNWAEAKG